MCVIWTAKSVNRSSSQKPGTLCTRCAISSHLKKMLCKLIMYPWSPLSPHERLYPTVQTQFRASNDSMAGRTPIRTSSHPSPAWFMTSPRCPLGQLVLRYIWTFRGDVIHRTMPDMDVPLSSCFATLLDVVEVFLSVETALFISVPRWGTWRRRRSSALNRWLACCWPNWRRLLRAPWRNLSLTVSYL